MKGGASKMPGRRVVEQLINGKKKIMKLRRAEGEGGSVLKCVLKYRNK